MAVNDVLYDEGGAFCNVQSTAIGLVGDGVTDNATNFYANLTSGGHYVFPAGTYLVNSDTSTLPADIVLQFEKGAILKAGTGKTLTLNCVVLAGPYQIFDSSLGAVSFASNRQLSRFRPEWWGLAGDGTTDDEPALAAMVSALPDGAYVFFEGSPHIALHSTWTIANREGITFTSERDGRQEADTVPRFLWGGTGTGTRLVFLDRCRNCAVDGFYFDLTSADVGVDLDGYDANGYGTQCRVSRNAIRNNANSANFVGVRISDTATTNQEYHEIVDNSIGGLASARGVAGVSMASGSAVLTASTSVFTPGDVGKRIRVTDAGSPSTSAPAMLDTTIASYTSGTSVTLSATAQRAVSATYALVGESVGIGIKVGANANAKRIAFTKNNIFGCEYGIRVLGGSFQSTSNSFTQNEVNISISNSSEPVFDFGANSEYSRQHLWTASGFSVNVQSARLDVQYTLPNAAYLDVPGTAALYVLGAATENAFPDPHAIFVSNAQDSQVILVQNWFSPSVTLAQLCGLSTVPTWLLVQNVGISDEPAAITHGNTVHSFRQNTSVLHWTEVEGTAGPEGSIFVASRSEANSRGAGPTNAWYVGSQAAVCSSSDSVHLANFRAFEARLPVSGTGDSGYLIEGLRVFSPDLTNGTSMTGASGVVIEPMAVTGVAAGTGIDQQGTADKNFLAGRTIQAAPASAPADADIGAAQVSFYLDETGNNLKVRVRYSDGTTLKTGTVALIPRVGGAWLWHRSRFS